ncbi:heterokaryon incompatibility protein-domain-containing protein [Cercophora newfieldiana]|uniref:Heterokaryon incompatibility protein-domain-containing protein n=1 Tax=Cercophora newfieldiana TaxID=92897 RepID=A0AA40CMY7_9PEZI|nr:heterokaryon incompatibility protein-domain-containing protein [Cercophora newfieldiana]
MECDAPTLVAEDGRLAAISGSKCPACLNLDYSQYTSFAPHLYSIKSGDFSPPPRARFRLVAIDEVEGTAAGGCPPCRVLQHAIDFFWNSKGSEMQRRKSWGVVQKRFERALCLVVQPGRSMLLFRVLIYDDVPDRSFIHAVTMRDVASRIELYRDQRLVDKTGQRGPCSSIGWAQHVPAVITLDRVVELTRRWMAGCDESHPKCAHLGPANLPKRLIDVRGGVRLVDTLVDDDVALDEPYMTLSHCWGSEKAAHSLLKTTHDTLYGHRQGIAWDVLPQLFRDVITLVRALGCRYVWIDSLCIIQDDPEDWMVESVKMSTVYNDSVLNIAATAMRSSSLGLFRQRIHGQGFRDLVVSEAGTIGHALETIEIPTAEGEPPIFSRVSHDRSHEVLYGDMEYFRTPMEPLLSRAWVFQERLLSRRTLHFGASEMLWECRTDCFCECSRIGDAHALSARNLNSASLAQDLDGFESNARENGTRFIRPKKVLFFDVCAGISNPLDFWLRAVEEYSFLYLSHERDRPFALVGIAERISRLTGDVYFAGLWLADLPRALVWSPCRSKKVFRATNKGIPSWSWMARTCYPHVQSTACAVRYKHVTQYGFLQDSRLKVHTDGTFCRYEHDNPFGQPVAGQVHISAACCWGKVELDRTRKTGVRWNGRNDLRIALHVDGGESPVFVPFLADRPGEDPETVRLSNRVLCVLIGSREVGEGVESPQYLLALAAVEGDEGLWERIGFSETEGKVELFDDAPILELKMV